MSKRGKLMGGSVSPLCLGCLGGSRSGIAYAGDSEGGGGGAGAGGSCGSIISVGILVVTVSSLEGDIGSLTFLTTLVPLVLVVSYIFFSHAAFSFSKWGSTCGTSSSVGWSQALSGTGSS
jgi:hypothetical protein